MRLGSRRRPRLLEPVLSETEKLLISELDVGAFTIVNPVVGGSALDRRLRRLEVNVREGSDVLRELNVKNHAKTMDAVSVGICREVVRVDAQRQT